MPVVKVKELIGISPKSFEDALKEAIKSLWPKGKCERGKNFRTSVIIKNGKIVEYKVNLNIAYLWEKKLYKK